MLKFIKVGNFLSFKEETEINFESSMYGKKEGNVFSIGKNILSKSMLIYGANASGKSNVLRAIVMIKNFALNLTTPTITTPFLLDQENLNEPSFFEIGFFVDHMEFIYNFKLSGGVVISENLFEIKGKKELVLFTRNRQNIRFENDLKQFSGQIEDKVKETISLLWVLDQFNGKLNERHIGYFFNKIESLGDGFSLDATIEKLNLFESEENKQFVLEFLKCADINICDIKIEKQNKPVIQFDFIKKSFTETSDTEFTVVSFGHQVKGTNEIKYFPLASESTGTIKLFGIVGMIVETITKEGILFFDEIENHLHPHVVKSLFDLINSDLGKEYQFIFTTHNIDLMDLGMFKKEQIGLTKKDKLGATTFESLYDYNIRSENDVKKMYNNGAFGGIPNVKDFSILLKDFKSGERKAKN